MTKFFIVKVGSICFIDKVASFTTHTQKSTTKKNDLISYKKKIYKNV